MQQDKGWVGLLIKDLIFETKIKSTASALGVDARSILSSTELSRVLADDPPALIVVDLNACPIDPVDAIEQVRGVELAPAMIAYVSHVDATLAEAAREAGADEVMPRSKFNAELPSLLGKYA